MIQIPDNTLTGKEIVDICNKYPDAKVSFETVKSYGLFTETIIHSQVRGYKLYKNSDNKVTDIIFVEDSVVPRNP